MKVSTGIIICILFMNCACSKEEIHECPVVEPSYQSIREYGDTATQIRVTFILLEEANSSECSGYFMITKGLNTEHIDTGVKYYKVSGVLPDKITNLGIIYHEWLVDIKYLGVGLECWVTAPFDDPVEGQQFPPRNKVELVEVYKIVPYQ